MGVVSEPDEHEFGLGWFVRFVDHRVPIAEVPLSLEETRTPEPNEREQDDQGKKQAVFHIDNIVPCRGRNIKCYGVRDECKGFETKCIEEDG